MSPAAPCITFHSSHPSTSTWSEPQSAARSVCTAAFSNERATGGILANTSPPPPYRYPITFMSSTSSVIVSSRVMLMAGTLS